MSTTTLKISPQQRPLRGTITVPSDKSISHRAIMLGALADGVSHIRNWLPAGDTLATLELFRALGVGIEVDKRSPQAWDLLVHGRGLHGLQAPTAPLDARNAGTCMRLVAGILAGQSFPSIVDGSPQLRLRPMRRITDPLQEMGAVIEAENGRAPLHIHPAALRGGDHAMKVASAQVKSALLLAGLYADGETRVYQPGPARDHTERMLQALGVPITEADGWVTLPKAPDGGWKLQPLDLTVPGDISSAAFPLAAAAIVPHSQITLQNVGYNGTRNGLLDIWEAMGAAVAIANERTTGGETAVDLTFSFTELHSADVGGATVVRAIDELPIWAITAVQAAGTSVLSDAAELRVKEVDRIGKLAEELRKLGVPVDEKPDGFAIDGPVRFQGGVVDSHGDHRLAMALAVAGLAATASVVVHDAECVADSFPGFVETMQTLGASMEWIE